MWLFLSAAWVSAVAAVVFVWRERRAGLQLSADFSDALDKRFTLVEQRLTRLETRITLGRP